MAKPSQRMSHKSSKRVRKSGRRLPARPKARSQPRTRAERAAASRAAIVAAGLDEFVARGFATTRLEDVARRAGVAKGTIYLHFKDKESLFHELVRGALVPLIDRLTTPAPETGSTRERLERFAATFVEEILATRRGDILRLIIAEGPRFPKLAEFYHREVVARGLEGLRALIAQGIARGEIGDERFLQFPQIAVAPALLAVIWQGLFDRIAPLDAAAMLRVHLDLVFGKLNAS